MGPDTDQTTTQHRGKRHKPINSWLLVLALGEGRCTTEREETGTDRGWDVLQEPQGQQCWLPTPQTQGCSPTGEGSAGSWAEGMGKASTARFSQTFPCQTPQRENKADHI